MENKENGIAVNNDAGQQHDWQNAERRDSQLHTNPGEEIDLRSAEAGGYGIDNHDAFYASRPDEDGMDENENDDIDEDDSDSDDDDDDDDDEAGDWGDVDPQSGGFPTGNEPTAPGSAV